MSPTRLQSTALPTLLVFALAIAPATAEPGDNGILTDWRPYQQLPERDRSDIAPYCPGGFTDPLLDDPDVDPGAPNSQSPIRFLFNDSTIAGLDEARLSGQVTVRQNTFQAEANEILYRHQLGEGELSGEVILRSLGLIVAGDRASLDFDSQSAEVNNAGFALHNQDVHGHASQLRRDGPSRVSAQQVAITRCMPEDPHWSLRAARFEVDQQTGIAKAWHARFHIRTVPVLYVPYVSFPIDDRRRSGFLPGTYGLGDGGLSELAVPYYFNLAPNYDDTLTLHYFGGLGLLARNEFRFLTPDHNGISDIDIQLTQEAETQNAEDATPRRYAIAHRQSGQLGANTGYRFDTRWVSDIQYDQNFNNGGDPVDEQELNLALRQRIPTGTLNLASQFRTPVQDSTEAQFHLATLSANTRIDDWSPSALAEWQLARDSQVSAADFEPKRLPELTIRYRPLSLPGQLTLNHRSTYSYFTRQLDTERLLEAENSDPDLATNTHRYYFNTGFGYPMDVEWGYLRPELETLGLAYYQSNELDNDFRFAEDGFNRRPAIANWRFTVDSKLIAERPYSTRNGVAVHSIEPRLHYTYTPYVDHNDLPNLNTEAVENDFALFTKERFTGLDRIGDMNRLSAALDTRLRDRQSGNEQWFLGLSKGVKLSQERVTEQQSEARESGFQPAFSPTYLNARWTPQRAVQVNASAQWAHRSWGLEAYSADVTFLPRDRRFLRFGLTRTDTRQSVGASGYWTIRENMALIGYANWARPVIDEEPTGEFQYTDLVYGLDYDNCCWNIRLVGFNSLIDEDAEADNTGLFPTRDDRGIRLEFTLKGLGGSAGNVEALLESKVPGYNGRLFRYR
ncbi:MAG: LPS-assembly protein LptD [Saccharospirillum sp.]